jgi:hypothetical protein
MPSSPANTAEELNPPSIDMLPLVTGGEVSSATSLQNHFSQSCISITSRIHTGWCSAQKIQTELEIAGMDRRKKLWRCGNRRINLIATKWTNSCCQLKRRIHRFLSEHCPTLQQIPLHLDFCWNPDTLTRLLKLTTETTAVRKRLTEWW